MRKFSFNQFLFTILLLCFTVGNSIFVFANADDSFYILHVNDNHGRIEADSALAEMKDGLTNEGYEVLTINAGDAIHGTAMASMSQGEIVLNVMNFVGYDYLVPGNHDFNFGFDRLLEVSNKAKFQVLASNIVYEDTNEYVFKPYDIKEINGVKVGIFAIATPETVYKSSPKNTEGLLFTDYIKTSKEMVSKLESENVDMIIMLSHLGIDMSSIERSDLVAETVTGIDLIVDGHSHTVLEEAIIINDTMIVQAGSGHDYIGKIKVSKKEDLKLDYELIKADVDEGEEELPTNKEVDEYIALLTEEIDKITKEVVGVSNVYLEGEREVVRTRESNLASILATAALEDTGADVALINGGGIRASIDEGDITVEEIYTVLPFGGNMATVEILGKDLLAAMEFSVDSYPEPSGKFLHVAGMEVTFNPNEEAGNRIVSINVGKNPLDLEKSYKIVTGNFIAVGGDGYDMIAKYEIEGYHRALEEMFIDYIKKGNELYKEPLGNVVMTEGLLEIKEDKEEAKVVENENIPKELVLLEIPEKQTQTVEEVAENILYYTVKKGDTLSKIAVKYNTNYEELSRINGIKNPNLIYINQVIKIRDEENTTTNVSKSQSHGGVTVTYLDGKNVSTTETYNNTLFGGISGITYDSDNDLYYLLSDDRAEKGKSRFYEADIETTHNGIERIVLNKETTIKKEDGTDFGVKEIDPEAIFLINNNFLLTSEGGSGISPFFRVIDKNGNFVEEIELPYYHIPNIDNTIGIHGNQGHETITSNEDKSRVFIATENGLIQDGNVASLDKESYARIVEYDVNSKVAISEYVYEVSKIPTAPAVSDGWNDNGLSEMIYLGNNKFLAIERCFAQGYGYTIKMFLVDTTNATNILGTENLDNFSDMEIASKELLFDFTSLGLEIDNIEGVSFGPKVNGKDTLVFVGDNNFSNGNDTQFLLFSIDY